MNSSYFTNVKENTQREHTVDVRVMAVGDIPESAVLRAGLRLVLT